MREAVLEFSSACDRFVRDGTAFPARLRVKPITGAPGVFEMTWSFAGPDGRATWEWVEVDVSDVAGRSSKAPAVRWRRLGDHGILREP